MQNSKSTENISIFFVTDTKCGVIDLLSFENYESPMTWELKLRMIFLFELYQFHVVFRAFKNMLDVMFINVRFEIMVRRNRNLTAFAMHFQLWNDQRKKTNPKTKENPQNASNVKANAKSCKFIFTSVSHLMT